MQETTPNVAHPTLSRSAAERPLSAANTQTRPSQTIIAQRPPSAPVQCATAPTATSQLVAGPNQTGLPDQLKVGVEALSGMDLSSVRVHRNSAQPAQLNALAYAQGTDIHLGPGQEKHLPHEAWHVVQQAQGRVKATRQMKTGIPINDDETLEAEADAMGAKAMQFKRPALSTPLVAPHTIPSAAQTAGAIAQRVSYKEVFDDLKADVHQLGLFSSWIEARAGKHAANQEYLLAQMSLAEVKGAIAAYAERTDKEKATASASIDDVIKDPSVGPQPPPDQELDKLFLSSPHIGEIIGAKQKAGVSLAGEVIALNDAEFAQRHWEEFLFKNARLLTDPQIRLAFKLKEMARVDRVDGFQSDKDGKIYLRPTRMGMRIAIHEGVHKYGGQVFEALLGHPMNEGATDYIALVVCAQIGAEIAPEYYPQEKRLLIDVLKVLKIDDKKLFAAYFNDQVSPISDALVARIGAAHAVTFRKAKTASDAAKEFNAGQQLQLAKK